MQVLLRLRGTSCVDGFMVLKTVAAAHAFAKTRSVAAAGTAAAKSTGVAQMQARVAELSRVWKGARTPAQALELQQLQKTLALPTTAKPPAALVGAAFKDPTVRVEAFYAKRLQADLLKAQASATKHGNIYGDVEIAASLREGLGDSSKALASSIHDFALNRHPGFAKLSVDAQQSFVKQLVTGVEEKTRAARGMGVISPRPENALGRVPKDIVEALRTSRRTPSAAAEAALHERFLAHVAKNDSTWKKLKAGVSRQEELVASPGLTARRRGYELERLGRAQGELTRYEEDLFAGLKELYPAIGRR